MKKKALFLIASIVGVGLFYFNSTSKNDIELIRKQHAEILKNHPYNKTKNLSKKERRAQGLPPNAFFDQEYLNEINPYTGRTHRENVFTLQEELAQIRETQRVPGDANDNAWEERGPNNVGGRTRAVIFDPNDATQETVYAGGVSGGLWKNTNISDENSTWTHVDIPENLAISCIAIDPNDSMIWYVGTGESYVSGDVNGTGVWKSTDGGTTWGKVFGGVIGDALFESNAKITINSPASLAGEYSAALSTAIGVDLVSDIVADLVLAEDDTAPTEDGCTSLINGAAINGKIAVIKRGTCGFQDKVANAQTAGAIAVVIVNNQAGYPINQAGDDLTLTIPTVMVSQEVGNSIIAALGSSVVNVKLSGSRDAGSNYVVSNGIQHVNDIVVRDNGGVSEVYVAATEAYYGAGASLFGINDKGVYKSVDGVNFTQLNIPKNASGNEYNPNNIKIAADNSVYISTTSDILGEGGGVILQSTDANATVFEVKHIVPSGLRTEIACSKTDADKIYVLAQLAVVAATDAPVGMYKTTNGFDSVSTIVLPNDNDIDISYNDFTRGQSFYDLLLRVDPNDDSNIYIGGIDLFKSTTSGFLFSQISKWSNNNLLALMLTTPIVHADQHGLAFSTTSSDKMVFSNDGGVYFSDDGGSDIEARNKGYNTLQFYSVGVAPTTALPGDNYIAGAQDNGTQLFENVGAGVNSSVEAQGGDGAYSFFDQDGTDQYYISNYVYNASIMLYDLGSGSEVTINSETTTNGDFINQEELDSNLDILYSNYSNTEGYAIRRYKNIKSSSVDKTSLTNALLDNAPSAMKVSPYTTASSKLFAGLKSGKLLKIEDANGTPVWSEITGAEFLGSISDIEFGTSEDEIFVTMHNYGVKSIWYTDDAGESWSSKEGNLPDIPVKAILQNPLNTQEVIIGTELGIWRTANFNDEAPIWVQSNNGMNNVKVMDLDLRDDNAVFAATYGRGVFSGQFSAEVASVDEVIKGSEVFTIYPTISNGNFTVLGKNELGKMKIHIFDLSGKKVYQSNLDFNIIKKQEVSVNLSSGVYIVNLIDENNQKASQKIVIE
ncbi:T9SS type A sorting domain-containing protein [Polaribacter sp. MSW13]|uniref:T9SS type A sorting domain-containing protein n=1 Tax=Polaribacter marinus TaxID=2916838 RepID=A0A9X1VMN2_9FLAO|nr:PA domain-containing protein [Polaribacter marinus]MCI2229329.1 T9SS type A sorting domain-containing protein [Polaribacter marinus]